MTIIFEHPVWYLVLCALGAAGVSYVFYRKDKSNRNFSASARLALTGIRFLALFIIAFFLLKPLIKSVERELEPPIIVIAHDNSASLALSGNEAFYENEWPTKLSSLTEKLGQSYEVNTFRFGDQFEEGLEPLDYSGKLSDYSAGMDALYNRYSNRNVGAVVIIGDGIYNAGANPLYGGKRINAPHYTVALGDTTKKRDVRILDLGFNKIAYLGNRFPLELVTEMRKAAGTNTRITVSHKGKTIYSEQLSIDKEYMLDQRRIVIEANEAGVQKYTLEVKPVDNETSLLNNKRDVYIEVIENRQKVLIVGAAPHPDIAALKNAISSNENYDVESSVADNFKGKIEDYSLIILHQIPSITGKGKQLLLNTQAANKPFLLVMGAQTDYQDLNSMKLGFQLRGNRNSNTDVFGSYAKGFPLFKVSEEFQRVMNDLPPLSVAFGDFETAPGVTSLVHRRVGSIETEVPLIGFNQVNGQKIGVIGGEGIWRWRLTSFLRNKDHKVFDGVFSSIVQYLASRDDRKQFRVRAPKELTENESIIMNAELYNASFEPINEPEVNIELTNESGENFNFSFARNLSTYRLDAGQLPPGVYTWKASARHAGVDLTDNGLFTIIPLQLESASTEARHDLLYKLATDRGGNMFSPDQTDALVSAIEASDEVVTLSYERKLLSDLINLRWLLAVILVLLSAEWLIRKWSGTY